MSEKVTEVQICEFRESEIAWEGKERIRAGNKKRKSLMPRQTSK
jgi:hypothetical protein